MNNDSNNDDDRKVDVKEKIDYYLFLRQLLEPNCQEYTTVPEIYDLYGKLSSDEHYDDFIHDLLTYQKQYDIITSVELPRRPILYKQNELEKVHNVLSEITADFEDDGIYDFLNL